MKYLLLVFAILCMLSCGVDQRWTEDDLEYSLELQKKAFNGDTSAYLELNSMWVDAPNPSEPYLIFTLDMANRFNYPHAYKDVYEVFIRIYKDRGFKITEIDSTTRELMLSYLKKAVEKKVEGAQELLDEHYKIFPPK